MHVCFGLSALGEATVGWAARHVDALRREHGLAPDPRGERLYDRLSLSLMPHNARAVAAAGASVAVEDGPTGLAAAVRAVLEDPAYGLRAREVAAEMAALPPVDEAVDLLELERANAIVV